MEVEIRESEPRKAVCMSHCGPYPTIGHTFGKLAAWIQESGIEAGPFVGLYYDDPRVTPAEELRSDAGAFVLDDFTIDDPGVHVVEVAGGVYAVGTHVGSYEGLANAWQFLIGTWLPSSGAAPREAPCFEVYLDDCSQVPQAQLRTEIYIPIKTTV